MKRRRRRRERLTGAFENPLKGKKGRMESDRTWGKYFDENSSILINESGRTDKEAQEDADNLLFLAVYKFLKQNKIPDRKVRDFFAAGPDALEEKSWWKERPWPGPFGANNVLIEYFATYKPEKRAIAKGGFVTSLTGLSFNELKRVSGSESFDAQMMKGMGRGRVRRS